MKKLLLGSSALAVLAGVTFLTYGQALAASPDDLDREKAQLRKENADLRELLRMRDENAALRAHLQAPAPIAPTKPPLQAARTELVHGVPTAALANLYDADMSVPVYKASPPPIAYYNWTGFYVGGNVGYGIGQDPISQTLSFPAGGVTDTSFTRTVVAPKGVIGGVQFGYNVQSQSWLAGVEFDFQGSGQQDKACGLSCLVSTGPAAQQTLNVEQQLQYFGTARARIGAVDNNVLYYVTGGGAYGRVSETTNVILNAGAGGATSVSNQITDNQFGWVVGAGIEAGLWGNWTAKVEYLYMDLGHLAANSFGFAFAGTPGALTTNSAIRDNIVRAGLNYRLGPETGALYDRAPVAALPQYHWTGFYVGGNFGYAQAVDRLAQTATGAGVASASNSDDFIITPKGFAGGLQLGYNWQGGGNWLAGFEADIQGTTQNDTTCTPLVCFSQTNPAGGGNDALYAKQTIDYFATVRGRVGFVNNNVLYYGTGGAALGHVNETVGANFTLGLRVPSTPARPAPT